MKIISNCYEKIFDNYPNPPPEQGGILGMKSNVVCEYYHDSFSVERDKAIYEPNVVELNKVIEQWNSQKISFAGIIHSHLAGQNTLSSGDKEYIRKVLFVMPASIKELYFPIVIPEKKTIISYVAMRNKKDVIIQQDEIHIISQ